MSLLSSSEKAGARFGVSAVEAGLTAAAHFGLDKTLSSFELSGGDKLVMAGMSAASSLASRTATEVVMPYIAQSSILSADAERRYIQPLMSGAIYVAANMFLKTDKSDLLKQFLMQVGANAVASYLAEPLYQMASGRPTDE